MFLAVVHSLVPGRVRRLTRSRLELANAGSSSGLDLPSSSRANDREYLVSLANIRVKRDDRKIGFRPKAAR